VKIIIVILVALLLLLQYKVWLGDGGIPEILQLQKEVDEIQAEANLLKERNKALEAEVSDLKTGLDAIEERARNELGMIGKDEVYYQVVETRSDRAPNHIKGQTPDSKLAPLKSQDNQ
jgi:cell division protein FtsB